MRYIVIQRIQNYPWIKQLFEDEFIISYLVLPLPRGIQIYLKYFTWGSFRLLSIYEFLSGNQSLEIAPSNNGRLTGDKRRGIVDILSFFFFFFCPKRLLESCSTFPVEVISSRSVRRNWSSNTSYCYGRKPTVYGIQGLPTCLRRALVSLSAPCYISFSAGDSGW